MAKLKVGVLASGRGSNLQALIDRAARPEARFEVVTVISDVETAVALDRARRAGIPAVHIPPGRFRTKLEPEVEIAYAHTLGRFGAEVVALAGFMRVLHEPFLSRFPGRVVNIHPSLLPSFPGLGAQRQAVEHGVRWSGCTVHLVNAGVDAGPIVLQAAVPVRDGDTAETLAERILKEEHRIYPEALELIADGRLILEGRCVRILPPSGVRDASP